MADTIKSAYRVFDEETEEFKKYSFETLGQSVIFDDGQDAETKLGAINGITDSLVSDSSDIALSAAGAHELNKKFGGLVFKQDAEGNWGYLPKGADTVIPFNNGNGGSSDSSVPSAERMVF